MINLQIGIGHNRHSWIKKMTARTGKETVETPNILSPQEFRKFWVSWYGEILRLGRDGETKPIIAFSCRNSNLKYVTFSAIDDNRNPVHWKIECKFVLVIPE